MLETGAASMRAAGQHGGALLGFCVIVAIWLGVLHHLSQERDHAERAAVQTTQNLARVFEEHIVRSIKAVDQSLLYIRAAYVRDPFGFDIDSWRAGSAALMELSLQIAIIDRHGTLKYSSLGPVTGHVDLSQREHFRAHADSPEDHLFISKPVLGRQSGKWSIQLTRRIADADGVFAGVVVISLDPDYLSRLYDSVDLGQQGVVTLVGLDGVVRARGSRRNAEIGGSIAGGRMLSEHRKSPNGTYRNASRIDGIERILSYRAVKDYPLIVAAGLGVDEVLAGYRHNRSSYLLATGALTLLYLAVLVLILRRQAKLAAARERLRISEAKHRTAIDNLRDVVFQTDLAGRWTFLNPAWREISGYTVAESLGRSSLEIVHRDDHALNAERYRALMMREVDHCRHEVRIIRKDGQIGWIEVVAQRLADDAGRIVGSSGLLNDITQKHEAAEALRAGEARLSEKSELLELTLENMSQGIMMIDGERIVQVCNRRAIELLGLPENLVEGKPRFDAVLRWQWQSGEFGEQGQDVEAWLRQFVQDGGIAEGQQIYERQRPNGTVLEIRSLPLPDGGVVRTYTDITARKQSEAALRAARDEADRAARAKSDFLAMMSHEIRSPLHGLLGIAELLRKTPLDAEQVRMLELLLGSAGTLQGVLDDVLDFSKIDAGAIVIAPEPVALRKLIVGIVEPMSLRAGQKDVALESEIAADLPDGLVLDRLRVGQILINLLSNAIKFTAAGRINVAVTRTRLADGGPGLSVAVADTGVGMSDEVLTRLFEPFTQADASTTRNYGGTGLGLSISRRLARLLGGDLTAESQPGEGSRFTLEIPLVEAPAGALPAVGADTLSPIEGDFHVLVAEDQPTNRWLIGRQLERLGVQADVVEDGFAALAALEQRDYDLLITDCHMPGMEGTELAAKAREREARLGARRMPIVGLTADIMPAMRARCEAAGMDAIETKPIDLHRLAALLRRYLQHQPVDLVGGAEPEAVDQVFDDSACRELFEDDPEGSAEWLRGFLAGAAEAVGQLKAAGPAASAEALVPIAHRLAGSALTAGAARLGMAARALELASLAGGSDAGLLAAIEREFGIAEVEILSRIRKVPEVVS